MAAITISKRTIGAKKTETIKNMPNVAVTVWVEKGSVEVLSSLGGKAIGKIESAGSVPLDGTALHLRNPGKTSTTVFIAMAPIANLATATPAAVAAPVVVRWNLFCDNNHGLVNPQPLMRALAEELQTNHENAIAGCRNQTELIEA